LNLGDFEAQIHSGVRTSFERHVGVSTIKRNVDAPTIAQDVDADIYAEE
jgi:hypothetical protein